MALVIGRSERNGEARVVQNLIDLQYADALACNIVHAQFHADLTLHGSVHLYSGHSCNPGELGLERVVDVVGNPSGIGSSDDRKLDDGDHGCAADYCKGLVGILGQAAFQLLEAKLQLGQLLIDINPILIDDCNPAEGVVALAVHALEVRQGYQLVFEDLGDVRLNILG